MDRQKELDKELAIKLLTHYLRTAWLQTGLKWNEDNDAEIETIIDCLTPSSVTNNDLNDLLLDFISTFRTRINIEFLSGSKIKLHWDNNKMLFDSSEQVFNHLEYWKCPEEVRWLKEFGKGLIEIKE